MIRSTAREHPKLWQTDAGHQKVTGTHSNSFGQHDHFGQPRHLLTGYLTPQPTSKKSSSNFGRETQTGTHTPNPEGSSSKSGTWLRRAKERTNANGGGSFRGSYSNLSGLSGASTPYKKIGGKSRDSYWSVGLLRFHVKFSEKEFSGKEISKNHTASL